ncbi:MAG: pteridine reductase [Gammaproteobacteria bacterium]
MTSQTPTRNNLVGKTILITGGAQRVGAQVVRRLHAEGANIALHYRSSSDKAEAIRDELEAKRPNSVVLLQADLLSTKALPELVNKATNAWGRLDVLINNASTFYPTKVGTATEADWDDLIGSNAKAPFFLSQAAAPELARNKGVIINMVDVYAERPLLEHPVYCMGKAAIAMLTKSLARELGPDVRVNGVAPGVVLWPEGGATEEYRREVMEKTALSRPGDPDNIASTILFLIRDVDYITGQIIAVDGGRSLNI